MNERTYYDCLVVSHWRTINRVYDRRGREGTEERPKGSRELPYAKGGNVAARRPPH